MKEKKAKKETSKKKEERDLEMDILPIDETKTEEQQQDDDMLLAANTVDMDNVRKESKGVCEDNKLTQENLQSSNFNHVKGTLILDGTTTTTDNKPTIITSLGVSQPGKIILDSKMNENGEIVDFSSPEREEQLRKDAVAEVAQKSNKQILEEYLADPSTKDYLANLANLLKNTFKLNDGWFDLLLVNKFTPFKTIEEALRVLNLLKLSNLLIAKIDKGKEVYKITATKDSRIRVLKTLVKEAKKHLETLEKELETLEPQGVSKESETKVFSGK